MSSLWPSPEDLAHLDDDLDGLNDEEAPEAGSGKPTPHQPRRPDWRCTCCNREWPCVPARAYMLDSWEPTSRAMTMGARLAQACQDMPDAPAGELYRRFLGWVRGGPSDEARTWTVPPANG